VKHIVTIYAGPILISEIEKLGLYEIAMRLKLLTKVTIDRIIYRPSSKINCTVSMSNPSDATIKGTLIAEIFKEGELISSLSILDTLLQPASSNILCFEILSPREEGIYTLSLTMKVNESNITLGSVDFAVGDPTKRDRLHVAFVWHNHQAPNYYPDGIYHSLWAFIHTYADEFLPYYRGGAYLVHTYIMSKHPMIKVTYHLSPSLLYQWKQAIKQGYKTTPYTTIKLPDPRVARVKEALDNYAELLSEGRIEVLSSFFAHPIAGFLLKRFSKEFETMRSILIWELKRGLNTTLDVMGVSPSGAWCPEMFWNMKLVPLFNETGITYTVLCEQHFKLSKGEKATIYEPYIVKDAESGKSIIVFFRDRELSDWLGFKNNMPTLDYVDKNLRGFILALYRRYLSNPGKVVVIALDGENWMIMSNFPPHTAVFLDKLYEELECASEYFETVTLREALERVPPRRELSYVPWGSWIGLTASQWTGGIKDKLWEFVEDKLKIVADFLKACEDTPSVLDQVYEAMAIAMDSDYFWYGEEVGNQKVIKTWASHAVNLIEEELKKVRVISVKQTDTDEISIELAGELKYNITLSVTINDKLIDTLKVLPGHREVKLKLSSRIIKELEKENVLKLCLGNLTVTSTTFTFRKPSETFISGRYMILGIVALISLIMIGIIVAILRGLGKGIISREALRI